ncbi:MAG: hypothetical protein K8W52_27010 [Deltaproteobacteria bacterium]|nr:hypothetical protein [Deltaproteobacteria bacterium]
MIARLGALAFALAASACFVVPARQYQPPPGDPYAGAGGTPPANTSSYGDPAGPPGATAPAGPAVVSVTIRSSCGSTVRVFYGEKPPYSSGTSSTISSHSVESHQFRAGDMVWLVDEHDQPVASTGVGPGTREIEVPESCNSLIAH